MRFFIVSILTMILSISALAQQQPVKIESKLDSKLKEILETVVSAVVGRVPGVVYDSKSFVIADTTNLENGSIDGLLNLQIGKKGDDGKLAPVFGSQAQVAVRIYETANAETAQLNISTTGQVASGDFITFVELMNSSICIAISADECKVQPVVDAQDASLSIQKQGEAAVQRLKSNLIAFIDAKVATAAPAEEQQSFGGIFGGSDAPAVDPEKMQNMRAAVEAGIVITAEANKTLVSINMDAIRAVGADLSEMNPALGAIQKFSTVQMEVTEAAATYQLVIASEFPKRLVTNYDAYIKQKQAEDQLVSTHALVMKITWWATGRCTSEKYQEMCITKILNTCATSVESVGKCITEAEYVQQGRDYKNKLENLLGIGN